jgi:hypothetical protein
MLNFNLASVAIWIANDLFNLAILKISSLSLRPFLPYSLYGGNHLIRIFALSQLLRFSAQLSFIYLQLQHPILTPSPSSIWASSHALSSFCAILPVIFTIHLTLCTLAWIIAAHVAWDDTWLLFALSIGAANLKFVETIVEIRRFAFISFYTNFHFHF